MVSPILAIVKIRHVFRAIEMAKSGEEFKKVLLSPDFQDVAIRLIASENHIPKFLARKIYNRVVKGLSKDEERSSSDSLLGPSRQAGASW